jgi:hypothetical protein
MIKDEKTQIASTSDVTIITAQTKTTKIAAKAFLLWWRTFEGHDYSITISVDGIIRFVNLKSQVYEKSSIVRLEEYQNNTNNSPIAVSNVFLYRSNDSRSTVSIPITITISNHPTIMVTSLYYYLLTDMFW